MPDGWAPVADTSAWSPVAENKPEAVERFFTPMNPMPLVHALMKPSGDHAADISGLTLAKNAVGILTDLGMAQVDQGKKAIEAFKKGDHTEAIARSLAALTPILGPMGQQAADKFIEGDTAGGFGTLTSMALPEIVRGAPKVARAASEAASDVASKVPDVPPIVAKVAGKVADKIPGVKVAKTVYQFGKAIHEVLSEDPTIGGIMRRAKAGEPTPGPEVVPAPRGTPVRPPLAEPNPPLPEQPAPQSRTGPVTPPVAVPAPTPAPVVEPPQAPVSAPAPVSSGPFPVQAAAQALADRLKSGSKIGSTSPQPVEIQPAASYTPGPVLEGLTKPAATPEVPVQPGPATPAPASAAEVAASTPAPKAAMSPEVSAAAEALKVEMEKPGGSAPVEKPASGPGPDAYEAEGRHLKSDAVAQKLFEHGVSSSDLKLLEANHPMWEQLFKSIGEHEPGKFSGDPVRTVEQTIVKLRNLEKGRVAKSVPAKPVGRATTSTEPTGMNPKAQQIAAALQAEIDGAEPSVGKVMKKARKSK